MLVMSCGDSTTLNPVAVDTATETEQVMLAPTEGCGTEVPQSYRVRLLPENTPEVCYVRINIIDMYNDYYTNIHPEDVVTFSPKQVLAYRIGEPLKVFVGTKRYSRAIYEMKFQFTLINRVNNFETVVEATLYPKMNTEVIITLVKK